MEQGRRNQPKAKQGGKAGGRGVFMLAFLLVVVALGGLIGWLAGEAEDTLAAARSEVDRTTLVASLDLPPPPAPPAAETTETATPASPPSSPEPAQAASRETPEPPEPVQPEPVAPEPALSEEAVAPPSPPEPPGAEELPVTEPPAEPATEPAAADPPAAPQDVATLQPAGIVLAAVDPALSAPGPNGGALPAIAEDGREPWRYYARPFNQDDPRPSIAIVMAGLGQAAAVTQAAIVELPGAVTLAFSPYGRDLDQSVAAAREAGHEVLIAVPMEPVSYPADDPGPHTLLIDNDRERNRGRLEWVLGQAHGYVGILNATGTAFAAKEETLGPVLENLDGRGLLFLDASGAAPAGTSAHLPFASVDLRLDEGITPDTVDALLAEAETLARRAGKAIVLLPPYPVVVDRLSVWTEGLDSGVVLAPVSAMAEEETETAG